MGLFTSKKKSSPDKPEKPAEALPTDGVCDWNHATLQQLRDRAAIQSLVGRFACGIDFRDWDAFADLFTTMVSVNMDPRTAPSPPAPVPIAAWKKVAAASFEPYDSTHHEVVVDYINLNNDEAVAVSHFQASHYLANPDGSPTFVQKGTYRHTLMRTDDGWRISGWEQDVRWGTGNRAVLDEATKNM
ncbi:nuclear transport factor 2 family protein [Lewinella sp. 4G2]|uniref:nuclear transport factor 2 family protein n=1 Tax=Lewinella sp. 4G2 TaxID=1803372 RepID=UPI0007B4777C|nr:nuclear transport factor 2 family protein [Lewinella sp. 4G2]OAV43809.1 hypothetical protein A3850_004535 [Lewinella sp. 4G2]